MRVALGLEYDGSAFHGWQTQRGVRTVQVEVERALAKVAAEPISVICAGRTDTGVHACQQIIHFDTHAERSARSWVLGANAGLPPDVSILWAQPVATHFHARFSALSRSYDYVILNRQARPGLWHTKVSWECRELDVSAMRLAATAWLGEHDFSSFRAAGCQAPHPVRTVYAFDVVEDHGLIVFSIRANAFLQHMVRNFAGVLLAIGMGRQPADWAARVLAARQRESGGITAPPHGLYLTAVAYPDEFGLPAARLQKPALPVYHDLSFPR